MSRKAGGATPLDEFFHGQPVKVVGKAMGTRHFYRCILDEDDTEVFAHYYEIDWVTR